MVILWFIIWLILSAGTVIAEAFLKVLRRRSDPPQDAGSTERSQTDEKGT